jgi:predicted membrane-bound spermidine synthase
VLYRQVALFIALFMTGLAAGGLGMHRLGERVVQNKKHRRWMLMGLLALTALYVLAIPSILRIVPAAGLEAALAFYALAALSGALTGMGFPLAVSLYHEPGEPVARAAGAMDCMDHLGAMTGALLCATLWLPLWGLGAACAIVAGANLMALLFILPPSLAVS